MPNMSYCRFHNTVIDLQDCVYNIHETHDLSDEEKRARKRLIELCMKVAEDCRAEYEGECDD